LLNDIVSECPQDTPFFRDVAALRQDGGADDLVLLALNKPGAAGWTASALKLEMAELFKKVPFWSQVGRR
jgi:hypothetical protein